MSSSTTSMSSSPAWLDREAYPFRHHTVDLSSGRMHYVDEGTGETLLFVHGTPTWSFEFRHLIKALATRYRCVAPDHLGFGLSARPPDSRTRRRRIPLPSRNSSIGCGSIASR